MANERDDTQTQTDIVIIDLSLKPREGVAVAPQFHEEDIVDRCREGITVAAVKTTFATLV